MQQALFSRLEALYPELVEFRRDLHMHPELSFEEVRTPQLIAEYHRALGLDVRTEVGGRGVVATLKGGKPGKTVALRADFDALPINDEKDVPYKSTVPGVMHACGHDIHTAGLLGVAKVLSEVRDQLRGNVVFIHQFAEELTPGGAKPMIEDGCLDGVDVIYGAHVHSPLETGKVGTVVGPAMATTDSFDLTVQGKGGHGATPHVTVDPIVVASHLILALQSIVSRQTDPLKSAVVTIGAIHGGNACNVIPERVHLKGTVRVFEPEVHKSVRESLERLVDQVCSAFGAEGILDYMFGYPTVVNHAEQTALVEDVVRQVVGEENLVTLAPMMGGEDFAYYLQKVPGTFFFVGGRNEDLKAVYPHHHPRFDVDERSMLVTGRIFIGAVLRELGQAEGVAPAEGALEAV